MVNDPDYQALLGGILADPDADLPRLVLADWLEETGHPANVARAEYIRLAVDFARNPPARAERSVRFAAIRELETMFTDEWGLFLARRRAGAEVHVERSRGFVEVASLIGYPAAETLAELAARHPLRELVINVTTPWQDWPPPPRLPWVTKLAFHALHWVSAVNEFLSQVELPELRELNLRSAPLDDGGVVRLVQVLRENPSFRRLELLDLSRNNITDLAAHTLAAAEMPATLRKLDIDQTRITNAGREVLFRRFGFRGVRPRLAIS